MAGKTVPALSKVEVNAEIKKLNIFNLDPNIPILNETTGAVRDLRLEIPLSTDGLDLLADASHIFIVPASSDEAFGGQFFEVGNRFDIMNENAKRLFLAIETLETMEPPVKKCCERNVKQEFDIVVLGSDGGVVLTMVKKSEVAIIYYKNETLGYLTQMDGFGKQKPTKYIIADEQGDLFTLTHEEGTKEGDFIIGYMNEPMNGVGNITSKWYDLENQSENRFADTFGVEFDVSLEVESKTLMFAALFTIYFKFYKKENPQWMCDKLGIEY